jgi:hypothetical protein
VVPVQVHGLVAVLVYRDGDNFCQTTPSLSGV